MRRYSIFTVIILALFVWLPLSFAAPVVGPTGPQQFAPDRILVNFKSWAPPVLIDFINAKNGTKTIEVISKVNVHVLQLPGGKEVKEMVQTYQRDSAVNYAEPDHIVYAIATPNDPFFFNQWGMTKIQAPQAWNVTTGQKNIKIAILDTGIDQNHEDLSGKIVANRNFTNSFTVDDRFGHGTHVAGIAAAITNNFRGVAGVGFNSSLMNVKVMGDGGWGFVSWIVKGILWASDNGAKVINMSFGSYSPNIAEEEAVNYAWGKGVVLSAAAGNDNISDKLYPAGYTNCIAVAATDQSDQKAYFSNWGQWVDVAAPGVSIFSTFPNHHNFIGPRNYGYLSGTSMAAPHVAGLAALVFAIFPSYLNFQVRDQIEGNVDHIPGSGIWFQGRINAFNSVSNPLY